MFQIRLIISVSITILFLTWGCDSPIEQISIDTLSPQILDFIHTPRPNSLFRSADSLKYSKQYARASTLFKDLLKNKSELTYIESQYLINQYCYTLLKDYRFDEVEEILKDIELGTIETPANKADWHFNYGLYNLEQGNGKVATYHLRQAEGIYTDIYGRQHSKRFETLLALAQYYYNDIRLDSLKFC